MEGEVVKRAFDDHTTEYLLRQLLRNSPSEPQAVVSAAEVDVLGGVEGEEVVEEVEVGWDRDDQLVIGEPEELSGSCMICLDEFEELRPIPRVRVCDGGGATAHFLCGVCAEMHMSAVQTADSFLVSMRFCVLHYYVFIWR